jgi:nucleoside 2-deoxyribosyltransferase
MATLPRIYLAGPEVFLPNALEVGRAKFAMAAAAGLEGVFPLDASLDLTGLPKHEQARRISLANEGLMRSCDALIANLTPFRGASMDAGTAFEIGFMRALGRPVFGYTNATPDYRPRAEAFRARGPAPGGDCDRADAEVEDFGLAENLMIEIAILESGGQVVRHGAPEARMEDLTAFEVCLAQARTLIASRS